MRHRLHSICPYFAMFPESFAETWIARLSKPGDIVLDPFSGRGTTAFQSLLMGRRAIACDVNDVAYCITKAKTNTPKFYKVLSKINLLESLFLSSGVSCPKEELPEFFQFAYNTDTLNQIVFVRSMLRWKTSKVDCMIAALVLGALHGESKKSPSYLSNQMPRTISTKPAYSINFWKKHGFQAPYRNLFDLLRNQALFRYKTPPPLGEARIFHKDMRSLSANRFVTRASIPLVITSPPYLDVTNFEEDQWLRLWFLGGPPHPTRKRVSCDDRYVQSAAYWGFIADMWRMLGHVVAKMGHIVIRIGGRGVPFENMTKSMQVASTFSGRTANLVQKESSVLQRRQTDAFRPGTRGCLSEFDFLFQFVD